MPAEFKIVPLFVEATTTTSNVDGHLQRRRKTLLSGNYSYFRLIQGSFGRALESLFELERFRSQKPRRKEIRIRVAPSLRHHDGLPIRVLRCASPKGEGGAVWYSLPRRDCACQNVSF